MENQYCILPIGRLEDIEYDITRVKKYADFEVIDIIGDKDPYLNLLSIDSDFEKHAIIDLKQETMNF